MGSLIAVLIILAILEESIVHKYGDSSDGKRRKEQKDLPGGKAASGAKSKTRDPGYRNDGKKAR